MTMPPALVSVVAMFALEQSQLDPAVGHVEHVEVNGVRLAYVEQGQGEPVVFIHGGISDLTIWQPILEPIASTYRAIAYSRRYAWPNEPIPGSVADTIAQHATDLAELIKTLDLGPAHLVGNSFGGFISLIVARDHPELVRTLIVQEPPVVPLLLGAPPNPLGLLKLLATKPQTARALAAMFFKGMLPTQTAIKRGQLEESIEIFTRRVALGDAGYDELPEWVKRHMRLNIGTHVSQFRNNGGFVPFTPLDARSIRVPTLVMTGQRSPRPLKVLSKELAALVPDCDQIEIPNASHVMHLANTPATVEAILAFIAAPRTSS